MHYGEVGQEEMTTHSDFTIRALEPHETIAIRHSVLRPNQSVEQCRYEGDQDSTTFHFGAASCDGDVIGIATVLCCNEPRYKQFSSQRQFRLRGMAVLTPFQQRGIGKTLLKACLEEAAKRECQVFWCNARVVAAEFYLKCGFSILNDAPFEIEGIGPHHVMFKQLDDLVV